MIADGKGKFHVLFSIGGHMVSSADDLSTVSKVAMYDTLLRN
jgi:hypothetical protein